MCLALIIVHIKILYSRIACIFYESCEFQEIYRSSISSSNLIPLNSYCSNFISKCSSIIYLFLKLCSLIKICSLL
ncbi:unnamed protein product [Moneuplotes crassus]|uniref:Uncharacterized protein n=1 Tax=Euplotes crassus TaxID=5936 RepID=A0AAD2D1F1_EUPCR|nr:unnamed protein product [Moneuplotes crassus]